MKPVSLSVEVRDDLIVVMQHSPEFFAVYAMAPDEPQLKFKAARRRMTTPSWLKPGRPQMTRRASWGGSCKVRGLLTAPHH